MSRRGFARGSDRHRIGTCALLVALLGSVWALASGPLLSNAGAAITHHFLSKITEVPVFGPKGETVPSSGPLANPISLTVDSGHLWVAEFGGRDSWRTDEFGATSEDFLAQLPQPESPRLEYIENGIAVGHKTGETELYVGADSYPEGGGPDGSVAVYNEAHELQAVWTGADTPKAEGFGCFDCGGGGDVAVDNFSGVGDWAEGDVYVASPERNAVDVFKPEAGGKEKYVTQITGVSPTEPLQAPTTVAVDRANGEVVIGNGGKVDIFKPAALEPGYEFVRSITGTPNGPFEQSISGLAVGGGEQEGDIYVGTGGYVSGGTIDQYNYEGVYLGQLTGRSPSEPFNQAIGIAVDPETHHLFVAEKGAIDIFESDLVIPDVSAAAASNVRAHSATLNGTVKPLQGQTGEGAKCAFMWGESKEELTREAKCEPEEASGEEAAVHATLSQAMQSELQPDTTYYYLLKASNKNGLNPGEPIQIQQFTTPGPKIESASVTELTDNSVSLHAAIKPHGAPTSYYFEYSTAKLGSSCSACATVPSAPGPSIGSGESVVDVGQPPVEGLHVGTTYHYRVVAVSELAYGSEEFDSPEQTFTTQSMGGPRELPDNRQWELVTPPDEHGALVLGVDQLYEAGISQAADNGNAMVVVASVPAEAEPEGHSETEALLSARGSTGWSSRVLTPPHANGTGPSIGQGPEYRFFSEDLSRALLEPFGNFYPLAPEAITFTPYLRTNFYNANTNDLCEGAVDTAQSCYTPLLTAADSPGLEAGNGKCPNLICVPEAEGMSPDGSHVFFGGLDEWANGHLVPVSILPAKEGGENVGGQLGGGGNTRRARAVSENGERVVWSSFEGRTYLRENAMKPQSPAPGAKGLGSLITAEGTGTLTRGSTSVTEVAASGSGSFAAGQIVTGPGIAAGTTITAASGAGLTLSAPATGSGKGVALKSGSNVIGSLVAAAGTGTLTNGSSEVAALSTTTGEFVVGQPISGEGIPKGTTVTAVGKENLTLSAAATHSASGVAISSEGPVPFQAGWPITGEGIPAGTTITAVGPGTLTLSAAVTPVGGSVALSAGYECTVPADACTFSLGAGSFQTASVNDSIIYLSGGGGLNRYDLQAPEDKRVTELAQGTGVLAVIGASEDGSYVYYVGGNYTLYVEHEGKETAIAKLSSVDEPDWSGGDLSHMTARVSPNGHWVAFMSNEDLTGYVTADAVTGEADEQVYVYNALTNKLVCASCNPDGARPLGFPYESGGPSQISEADRLFNAGQGIAAIVPPWTTNSKSSPAQPRYLDSSGRVFFDSHDALVPQDVNGQVDVYEWEPAGVGSCTTSSPTFSDTTGGCVGLISSGSSPEESAFLSASETGGDVFFLTKAKLVPEAYETSQAVYDARECTQQSACYPPPAGTPPPCDNGDSCKPAPTPQPTIFGAPASATFVGAGNPATVVIGAKAKASTRAQKLAAALRACRKDTSKKHRRTCEASARKRYGSTGTAKTKKRAGKTKKRGKK